MDSAFNDMSGGENAALGCRWVNVTLVVPGDRMKVNHQVLNVVEVTKQKRTVKIVFGDGRKRSWPMNQNVPVVDDEEVRRLLRYAAELSESVASFRTLAARMGGMSKAVRVIENRHFEVVDVLVEILRVERPEVEQKVASVAEQLRSDRVTLNIQGNDFGCYTWDANLAVGEVVNLLVRMDESEGILMVWLDEALLKVAERFPDGGADDPFVRERAWRAISARRENR